MASTKPSLELFDKIRPRKTSEKIAELIRSMCVNGRLKPGDKLPTDEQLSQNLGVSRGAVRESLRALEVTGVVELRPGRTGGAFISHGKPSVLSRSMLDLLHLQGMTVGQLTEARLGIEEVVVRLACACATAADLAALDANIAEAKALFADGLMSEKAAVNVEFHNVLARCTRNPLLVVVMGVLTEVITAFLSNDSADSSQRTFRSRERFMVSLREKNADAAVLEMLKYIRRIDKIYQHMVEKKNDASVMQQEDTSPERSASAPTPRRKPRAGTPL